MGRYPKAAHAVGKERKRRSFQNVVDHGFDEDLEEECRALKAEDELRPYWVNKCLGERADARQAALQAAAPLASPADVDEAPAAPADHAFAAPPPADEAPAPPPADEAPAPPPANQAPAAPADQAPAAAN